MNAHPFSHLDDGVLSRNLPAVSADVSIHLATLLAYLAEFDARRLYRMTGYSSMHEYCMGALHFSDEQASKRIRVARITRKFPILYAAIAQDRLTLSHVLVLAPYLTTENVDELVSAATHKTRFEVEQVLAERFPRLDAPATVQAVSAPTETLAASHDPFGSEHVQGLPCQHAPGRVEAAKPPRIQPLAPERFALQVTIDQATYQKLCRAQELLSHTVPSGDIAQVLDRALELLVAKLEKRKFAATEKPRSRTRRASKNPRHIPAHVRRAVTERDGGQCTFVSEDGHRCATRRLLEFDHVEEVARGGVTTVDNIRLRCKAHNQYSAECTFGVGFMDQKRRARMERCINRGRCDDATPQDRGAEEQEALERDLAAGLKTLGYRPSEIREALAHCRTLNGASLEERMRAALALLRPRATTIRRPRAPLATSLERVDDPARIAAAG